MLAIPSNQAFIQGYHRLSIDWIMRVDAEASGAYPHTGRSGSVVVIADSTWLAVVVLRSCNHRGPQDEAYQQGQEAWLGHHQEKRHHWRHRHHSRFRKVQER